MNAQDKLQKLRALFSEHGIQGFLIPRSDEYLGEYVPVCCERLAWLTGFTGSAGIAAVMDDQAAVFSDGRYAIQLKQQIDENLYSTHNIQKTEFGEWLTEKAEEKIIGYDPKIHSVAQIERLIKKGVALKPLGENPVDAIWEDRPGAPAHKVTLFPEEIAGKSSGEKINQICAQMNESGVHACAITLSDSIAWLLNIRGRDVPHIPVALSYLFILAEGTVKWFIDKSRVPSDVRQYHGDQVEIVDPGALEEQISELARAAQENEKPVWLDFKRSPVWFRQKLEEAGTNVIDCKDPCIDIRACKTPEEQQAMRRAHIRDGVAVSRFLKWISEIEAHGNQSELSVEDKLESYRAMAEEYREPSFDTIAGFGPHGAIVHYRATEESNVPVTPDNLLLVDSGAQYSDGTTDITRTVAIGQPSEEMKRHFTLVLKGHIAVASAKFPKGTTGVQIDALARRPLWDEGLDYAHGTGHGVGCYLSVHEEAASLSPRGQEALKPGMILSNEPGYYKEGAYGIRTENLVLVKEDGVNENTQEPMLKFETITLAPIDKGLIIKEMLSGDEVSWLNGYHQQVFETLSPLLGEEERAWLEQATAAL